VRTTRQRYLVVVPELMPLLDEVLGVTLEPDEPLVPLLSLPAANAAAATANSAALFHRHRVAPSKD